MSSDAISCCENALPNLDTVELWIRDDDDHVTVGTLTTVCIVQHVDKTGCVAPNSGVITRFLSFDTMDRMAQDNRDDSPAETGRSRCNKRTVAGIPDVSNELKEERDTVSKHHWS